MDEGLPIADDVEGREPIAFLAFYLDDAVGDVRVCRDAFLLEGHQGTAHVGGGDCGESGGVEGKDEGKVGEGDKELF